MKGVYLELIPALAPHFDKTAKFKRLWMTKGSHFVPLTEYPSFFMFHIGEIRGFQKGYDSKRVKAGP